MAKRSVLPAGNHEGQPRLRRFGSAQRIPQDAEFGGMQVPFVLELAANGFFSKASVSIGGGLLTVRNANLLMAHGTEVQKNVFALNEFNGRFSGRMLPVRTAGWIEPVPTSGDPGNTGWRSCR
jgi:butyryl-CoA dehydrogenase